MCLHNNNSKYKLIMKKIARTIIILILTTLIFSCKGGFSGQKADSTMLDMNARDSAAALNMKVHQQDSLKGDSGKKTNQNK